MPAKTERQANAAKVAIAAQAGKLVPTSPGVKRLAKLPKRTLRHFTKRKNGK
jgi:hypothetical protein